MTRAGVLAALLLLLPGCATSVVSDQLEELRQEAVPVGATDVAAWRSGERWLVESTTPAAPGLDRPHGRRLRAFEADGAPAGDVAAVEPGARVVVVRPHERARDGGLTSVTLVDGAATVTVPVGDPGSTSPTVVVWVAIAPVAFALDVVTSPLQLLGGVVWMLAMNANT